MRTMDAVIKDYGIGLFAVEDKRDTSMDRLYRFELYSRNKRLSI